MKTNDKKLENTQTIQCGAELDKTPIVAIPPNITQTLAENFLPKILKFFENEENLAEFEAWKMTQKVS